MPIDVEAEIATALPLMEAARNKAAEPLKFSAAAAKVSDDRSKGQFRANLPVIQGGFASIKEGLLAASTLFGSLAKALAQFENPDAKEISVEQAQFAREMAERQCKLRVAKKLNKSEAQVKAADGIPCA